MPRTTLTTAALLVGAGTAALAGTTAAYAGSGAAGTAADSPGAGSGNLLQLPIQIPVNACGDSVDVIGLLNPVFGNHCANADHPRHPVRVHQPVRVHHQAPPPLTAGAAHHPRVATHNAPPPQPDVLPIAAPRLAETGADPALAGEGALGAVALTGGALLLRRTRRR